jgi:hypothetical protein
MVGAQSNIAVQLVARGLATVVRHRLDDDRAAAYDALLAAEVKATTEKKGLHSTHEAPVRHLNDLSAREAAQKARNYLPFLQRGGRQPAVVRFNLPSLEPLVNCTGPRLDLSKGVVCSGGGGVVRAPREALREEGERDAYVRTGGCAGSRAFQGGSGRAVRARGDELHAPPGAAGECTPTRRTGSEPCFNVQEGRDWQARG